MATQGRDRVIRFRRCMDCKHKGEPCGFTNNVGNGRLPMYRCRLHPSIKFYDGTIACEHYEKGRPS